VIVLSEDTSAAGPRTVDGQRPLRADANRNRERILAAAAEVFAARGLEVTLDEIAAHAGLGVGTVYRRFPNREALVEALFQDRLAGVAALAAGALEEPDSWAGLTRLLQDLAGVVAADQGLFEALICRPEGSGRVEVRERMLPVISEVFDRAVADGHLRPDIAATDFPMLLRMIATVAEYTRDVRPELWRRYLALLLDGLRASRDASAPLPEPALDPDEIDRAKDAYRSARR
jgi:AcrR family transcriptional regulator